MRRLVLLVAPAILLAIPAGAAAQAPVNVTMNPTGGSGVSGTAQLTAVGQQTQVVVTIRGGTASGAHVNHIHTGTCANQGGIVHPLTDIRTDASGGGSATSTVNAPLASRAAPTTSTFTPAPRCPRRA